MTNAPMIPNEVATSTAFGEPRTALCEYVAEVRRDLEIGHTSLTTSESVEQLIAAATHTHKTLVDHGQAFGEYVRMVQNWRQPAGA